MTLPALGIDLGGTNLRLGLVTRRGEMLQFAAQPVNWSLSPDDIVGQIANTARSSGYLERAAGVGLAISATIVAGAVIGEGLTTLPGFAGYPIGERLSAALGKPCLIENDSNCALHAEVYFGALKGYEHGLLMTLGTGIGGGLLLDGKIRRGPHTSANEIGLTLVKPPWVEEYEPIERFVSPGALGKRFGDEDIHLFRLAAEGNEKAQILLDEMFEQVGVLITNAHLLLDLEIAVLGGGLAAVGEPLREGVERAVRRLCPPAYLFGLKVALGALPADAAGVIGAAALWHQRAGLV